MKQAIVPHGIGIVSPAPGVSNEAAAIVRWVTVVLEHSNSMSLEAPRHALMVKVQSAYETAGEQGWDSYGARKADPFSFYYAQQFASTIPAGFPAPEVGVDPDGELSFEWNYGPRDVFTVSVSPQAELSYAGLFGRSTTYGTEQFVDRLPPAILEGVRRLARRAE